MASLDLHEKANFTRLSTLLVDIGTEALRNTFDGIHSTASLTAVLSANKTSLLKLKPRVINDSQWDLLYPPSGNPPDSKTFDVTLFTILFRNICGLPKTGWGTMPVDSNRSMHANIVRIRLFRNEVYAHVTSTQVDNATFEYLWEKISQTLVDLKISQKDIDDLKICPLGPREEEYVRMLQDWKFHEEESLNILEDLSNDVKSIATSINHLTQITEENCDGIKQLSHQLSSLEQIKPPPCLITHPHGEDENRLRKLAKHNFKGKIGNKGKSFLPGTRKWLLKKVEKWFTGNEDESKILLLTAGPGFGKSVFSARVCEEFKKKDMLAGCHFCDFNDSNLRNPMTMLESLASQMCENISGFKEKLIDQLKRPHEVQNLKDAFGIYLENPLNELELSEPVLIMIDGLDESAADNKNEIVNLIADYFPDLPEFIKVLVTSRPEICIAKLSGVQKINVEKNDADNDSDLEIYLKSHLPSLLDKQEDSGVFQKLVEMCEGSFLYAFVAQTDLQKPGNTDQLTVDEIMKFLPKGLGSHYQRYFRCLEDELKDIHRDFDVLRVLEVLVASTEPLPLAFISRTIGFASDYRKTKNIINKVNEALSSLFYVSDDVVTVFHKSVVDWLLARGYQDHEYTVKVSDVNRSLWKICEQIFEEVKENWCVGLNENDLANDVMYALNYGFLHLTGCDMKDGFPWLVDAVILYAILTISTDKWMEVRFLLRLWKGILQSEADLSDELRARISWHIVEIEFIVKKILTSGTYGSPFDDCLIQLPFSYLQSVLSHSPEGYFSDKEKKYAKSFLSESPGFVYFIHKKVDIAPCAIWCPTSTKTIKAVDVSKDKTMAAVAQSNGRISIVSIPSLVELWRHSTVNNNVSCCTFSPDDSCVLFGSLNTALSIDERKEIPFFVRHDETFKSCTFSPSGRRLVTSDGSSSIKLWDVAEQSLLSLLCANFSVNSCSFSATGMFIIGNRKPNAQPFIRTFSHEDDDSEDFEYYEFDDFDGFDVEDLDYDEVESDAEDSFCLWNTITWQRCDERSLHARKLEKGEVSQNELCQRCSRSRFEKLPFNVKLFMPIQSREVPYKSLSMGIYNDVECIFAFGEQSLSVIENTHFTTLAMWNCFFDGCYDMHVERCYQGKIFREVTAINDGQWLYADVKKLIVFCTLVPKSCAQVLWSSFSPDSSRLSTCTTDGFVNIWNVSTARIVQRFKCGEGKSPFACCWMEKFLFVFDFLNRIPSLLKFSVGVNSKIMISRKQQVSLCHVAVEFMPLSSVVSFSDGLLCFECGETKPVKVLDVTSTEGPQMVTLPGIEPKMSITVSHGASFIFGDKECREKKPLKVLETTRSGNMRIVKKSPPLLYGIDECVPGAVFVGAEKNKYYIWRRKSEEPAVYEFFFRKLGIPLEGNRRVISCFSNDSKVIIIAYWLLGRSFWHSRMINLETGQHADITFQYSNLNSKLFCVTEYQVVVAASPYCITFLDMDSGAFLGCSYQRYYTEDLLLQMKLSPDGTTLAFPKTNGEMKFLQLSVLRNPSLSVMKDEAALKRDDLINLFSDLSEK